MTDHHVEVEGYDDDWEPTFYEEDGWLTDKCGSGRHDECGIVLVTSAEPSPEDEFLGPPPEDMVAQALCGCGCHAVPPRIIRP